MVTTFRTERRVHFLCLLGAFLLLITSGQADDAGGKTRKPRYSAPKDGRPGRINVYEYFLIEDPHEAAATLMREAALTGLDVDLPGRSPVRNEIRFPSGETVDTGRQPFFEWAESRAGADLPADTVCLLKLTRGPSIRETASLMEQGIRFYRNAPSASASYFVRVPTSAAATLRENALVDWVGFLSPREKLNKVEGFRPSRRTYVETLVRDSPQRREELRMVGATVHNYHESIYDGNVSSIYGLVLDTALVEKLAGLWWVVRVWQFPDIVVR